MLSKNIIILIILPATAFAVFFQGCCVKRNIKFLLKEGSGKECSDFDNAKANPKDPSEGPLPANNHLRCRISLCGNGQRPEKHCGVGKCNAIGCKCDGGCIKGNAVDDFTLKHGKDVDNIHQERIDKYIDKAMKVMHITA